ncbi:MAG: AarF/UbiB family protein [Planctomycetota bacterium]|nr:AarF/UbiB family protein [Planctomycetota bacterium]
MRYFADMSLFALSRTYGNLKRLQQIISVLARHGFAHVLHRLPLSEYVPGLSYLKLRLEEATGASADLTAPERLTHALQELGATFIKFGQLLATRSDILPPDYTGALARLHDAVAPLPGAVSREIIVARLKSSVEEIFASFDDQPLASGSIGQVHGAVLRDGTEVVVKIKRPGTDERIREDLDLLAALAAIADKHLPELAALRPRMIVEEFARVMEREINFAAEASYTERFARDFAGDPLVQVPRVHWRYTTRDTLVLERARGTPLSDRGALARAGVDRRLLAQALSRCFLRQFFITGFFHADPHPGNIFATAAGGLALVDFGQMGHISGEMRRQMALMLFALAEDDVDYLVDAYTEIGTFTSRTDLRLVKSELRSLLDRYYGVPLDRLDFAAAFQEALAIARNNGIVFPRDFVLMLKSLVMVMAVLRDLDPEFRADEAVRPFVRETLRQFWEPAALSRGLGFYLYRLHSLLRRLPADLREILAKLREGEMRIIFHHEALEASVAQFERSVNRLTLGIIIAAITVGSSIVLAAGSRALGWEAVPFLNIPLAILVSAGGFALALLMGFWVAWGIIRGRRE